MHIEKINDNKIKVIFLREDILEWNINEKNLSENTPEMQNMVWEVLRRAEKEVGFSINGAQFQVGAMPMVTDEFVMIITRVSRENEANHMFRARVKTSEVQPQRKTRHGLPIYIFRFGCFDDAVEGSKSVISMFAGKSSLYKYEEKFYITILPFNKDAFFEASNILSEYSEKMTVAPLIEGRLREYGKRMIEDSAVEILAQQF